MWDVDRHLLRLLPWDRRQSIHVLEDHFPYLGLPPAAAMLRIILLAPPLPEESGALVRGLASWGALGCQPGWDTHALHCAAVAGICTIEMRLATHGGHKEVSYDGELAIRNTRDDDERTHMHRYKLVQA